MLHQVQTLHAMRTDPCTKRITGTVRRATLVYQQIDNGNIANQIHGFTMNYGKFIRIPVGHKYYTLRGS